jgi:Cu/Ag efflux pump CusA
MLKGILAFALTRRAIVLLGLVVFIGAGLFAVAKLNIEAYPNPAPVILEITAQAAGLSAEEMERYYTKPMEIGLYSTPGISNIRSTSFYGLSFVRVTFKYGVDYYFAYTQAALSLTQNVNLPQGQVPQIQPSSLVGEVWCTGTKWSCRLISGSPTCAQCRTGSLRAGYRRSPAWSASIVGEAQPRNSRSRPISTSCRATTSRYPN